MLLWWLADDPIEPAAVEVISDRANRVAVSVASVWEIAIKRSLGKLRFDGSVGELVRAEGFELVAITDVHAEQAGALPPHHRDPFDRMIIAQARSGRFTVVSRDPAFSLYDVAVLAG